MFWCCIWRFSGIGCAELASGGLAGPFRRNEAGRDGPASSWSVSFGFGSGWRLPGYGWLILTLNLIWPLGVNAYSIFVPLAIASLSLPISKPVA